MLIAAVILIFTLGLVGYFVSSGLAFGLAVILAILALIWFLADRPNRRLP